MIHTIRRDELLKLIGAPEKPLLVEVSSGETYGRLHIPGAVQLSLSEITSETSEYFPDLRQHIILYGISSESGDAKHAADFLDGIGCRHVFLYSKGKDDWILAGYPTESVTEAA